jgi:predicted PurR-regulated permease PerM
MRSRTAAAILGASVTVAMLWWASAVFVPLLLAILISHALEPFVAWLERLHCPRPIGVFLAVAGLLAGIAAGAYALRDPATQFVTQLPASARKLRVALETRLRDRNGAITRVQQVANDLERAAGAADGTIPLGVPRVRIEEPRFRVGDLMWRSTRELAALITQAVIVVCLVYYLLLARNTFRRKLARIAGPSFGRKRRTLRVLADIDQQIRRFLLARLVISAIVATATYAALSLLHVNQPGMWGLVSGALNVVPYIGPTAAVAGIMMATFAQFGTLGATLLAGGSAALIAAAEGYVITPRVAGRAGGMNALAIFVGILFFGWLWGVMGMLLAVPLLTVIKAACVRLEDLRPVAEMLSD